MPAETQCFVKRQPRLFSALQTCSAKVRLGRRVGGSRDQLRSELGLQISWRPWAVSAFPLLPTHHALPRICRHLYDMAHGRPLLKLGLNSYFMNIKLALVHMINLLCLKKLELLISTDNFPRIYSICRRNLLGFICTEQVVLLHTMLQFTTEVPLDALFIT